MYNRCIKVAEEIERQMNLTIDEFLIDQLGEAFPLMNQNITTCFLNNFFDPTSDNFVKDLHHFTTNLHCLFQKLQQKFAL